jgi:hypothetical protein
MVLDIESKDGSSKTRPGFTRPFMCGTYDGNVYLEFRDQHQKGAWDERYFSDGGCIDRMMLAILSTRYAGHSIYAHNAGRFDYLFLLPWLMQRGERLGFKFSLIPVASSIQVLDVWKDSPEGNVRKWRFLDSFKLIPTALDKAAKAFGLEGKLKHDLKLHENDPAWSCYLKQDCLELYRVLEKFHHYIVNVLGGEVGMTAPSTAMKLFRRKYLQHSLPRTTESHDFIREGYYGGRVEVFRAHGNGLRYYDINSSYPRAMLEPMPVGQGSYYEGEPPAFLLDRVGFVRAEVTVPDDIAIPPLPIKCDDPALPGLKGKLIFPTGKLSGIWEWGELQKAISLGATIERWTDGWYYESKPIFAEYVEDIYRYRDKSRPDYDIGLDQIAKILLNALYGKFGMKTERTTVMLWNDPNLPPEAEPTEPSPECLVYYVKKIVDAAYIMPQVSARVTALARVRLLEAMLQTIELGGEPYYLDTDSIITDVELPTSKRLGDLKDEYPEQSGQLKGRFLGPKLYVLEAPEFEKVTAKGFEERTLKLIEELLAGKTIIQNRLEKVGTLARHQFSRGPHMIRVPRTLRATQGKRQLTDNGRTIPWKVRMW